jgi:hypothetical protein
MPLHLPEIFSQIRDIPYRIPLASQETDFSCTGKHKLLKSILEEAGFKVRWRVCTFKWSGIELPVEVSETRHDDDSSHAYLEVLIDDDWKTVDATWDAPLSQILPVSEWDGRSGTQVAVKPLSTYSPEKSADIIEGESADVIDKDLERNGELYAAFNDWLERERN